MPEIIQYMDYNYNQWKVFEEQGIKTLNDIKRKQMSITSQTQFTPLILQ
jgi:high affinity cAMP-specific and IBMX-insensitive 3',5'-cyclic phosphodiesterase 8